jgi:colanic acid/amylovoran biosynthesis glycosyltransferase
LKPNLFIYRSDLLPVSETFIPAQAESLNAFRAVYVGLKPVPGLRMPEDRCIFLADGRKNRFRRARLKMLGPSATVISDLAALRPALMHAHFGPDAIQAMPIARLLRIPLVVTFHGYDATMRDDALRRASISMNLYVRRRFKLMQTATRLLCVSEYICRKVLEQGFPPDKTMVHYTGIDIQQFVSDAAVTRKPIVLFVGRLVEKKGCEYLIRAMRIVQTRVKDVELVVIGEGPLRKQLEAEARSTLRTFTFMGKRSAAEVREWLNKASVFSTPSIVAKSGDAEGFGMVFAEAQAMGLPVASFATGGIPEAVENGVTGLLSPERDVNALAHDIAILLTDKEMWRRFSAAGRERVAQYFNLAKQAVKLETIYQEVLHEHREKGAALATIAS